MNEQASQIVNVTFKTKNKRTIQCLAIDSTGTKSLRCKRKESKTAWY
ncbi:hypothetical protein BTN50_2123 [Candidatus Enterovibrio altilux]|uniref:Mobile element protein n=1 Tax=Candidatus Enterovibrio altilux TaxID=1927128 RepID=A0A291BC10_9GAMM|nr:hypothetical protein BTN50_2123 [Candidatus Enterovibrio luxaltus]